DRAVRPTGARRAGPVHSASDAAPPTHTRGVLGAPGVDGDRDGLRLDDGRAVEGGADRQALAAEPRGQTRRGAPDACRASSGLHGALEWFAVDERVDVQAPLVEPVGRARGGAVDGAP